MRAKMLLDREKEQAFADLYAWEYPTEGEHFHNIVMVQFGDPAVAYVWYEWISDTHVLMHMGADPKYHGRWMTKDTIRKIRYSWEFLGATRVYVVTSDEYVNNLATRQNFLQDEIGLYQEV